MHSKDVLLKALKDFGGAVVFVSHDRGFIEQLATQVLALADGTYKYYPGDYNFYLEQEAKLSDSSLENGGAAQTAGTKNGNSQSAQNISKSSANEENGENSAVKQDWLEQKKRNTERRKIERLVQSLEEEISALEEKKSKLEEEIAKPEVYSSGEKAKAVQAQIEAVSKEIESKTAEWEEAALKLED